MTLNI